MIYNMKKSGLTGGLGPESTIPYYRGILNLAEIGALACNIGHLVYVLFSLSVYEVL